MKRVLAMALAFLLLFCSSASAEKRKKREVQPVKLTLPLYYQTDYDQPIFTWKDRAITVAESGCGATCVSMVIGYFEPHREPEPDEIMRLAGEMGLYRGDGWGAMRFACCWRSMALRAAGARWMRGQSKIRCARGGRLSNTWGRGISPEAGIMSFCAALLPTANCLSPIRTAKKTRCTRPIASRRCSGRRRAIIRS